MRGSADGTSMWTSACQRVARSDRASSSRRPSTERTPTSVDTAIGKKQMSAQMSTRSPGRSPTTER